MTSKKKTNKVIINETIDLPLPPKSESNKGYDERKSSSPQSLNSNNNLDTSTIQDNNDDNKNYIYEPKVTELVTPFITDYVYDVNDIQLPRKLLYEGKLNETILTY